MKLVWSNPNPVKTAVLTAGYRVDGTNIVVIAKSLPEASAIASDIRYALFIEETMHYNNREGA